MNGAVREFFVNTNRSTLWILDNESDFRTILAIVASINGFQVRELGSLAEAYVSLDRLKEALNEGLPIEPLRGVIANGSVGGPSCRAWLIELRSRFPDLRLVCFVDDEDLSQVGTSLKSLLDTYRIEICVRPTSLNQVFELFRIHFAA
jgi:hypothetical protein